MAIYSVGGEADTFERPAGHGYAISTNNAHFDASVSRCAMQVSTGSSELILPLRQNTEVDELWLHFLLYQENVTAGNYIDIYNNGNTQVQYRIYMNADATWTFKKFDGTNFVDLGTTSAAIAQNSMATIDIHIIRDAATGLVEIYKDNTAVLSLNNTDTSTPNGMGNIRFIGLGGATERMFISQVIATDGSTLNWKLVTLAPIGNGTHTSWVGDYVNIDEVGYNPSDFIETNSVGQLESFEASDIPASLSTYNVMGLAVSGIFSNDSGSAVNDVQMLIRTNGSDYFSPNLQIVKDGSEQVKQHIWEINPDTGNPFTVSEVNAIEFGVKSV